MKKGAKNVVAKDVDAYLQALTEKQRTALEKVRRAIIASAPMAEEVISYQIPTYKYLGPLVHFAAFKNHCSLFAVSKKILKDFEQELLPFKTAGTTIQFSEDQTPPATLIKKIVRQRVKENEALHQQKKKNVVPAKKANNHTDEQIVAEFMERLEHPLKDEINAVRMMIKTANKKLSERIKWNAPSYYYKNDIVTFHTRPAQHVHLVFHHPFIVQVQSALLEGNYKDRRMVYLKNMQEIRKNKKELQRIINAVISHTDNEPE